MIWLLIDSRTVGGIERHVATLAEGIARQGQRATVVLLAGHKGNPWLEQLNAAGVSILTLDGTLGGLIRAIKTSRPGVIHTHGYKANILGRLAARLTKTPVVATFHAGERAPFPVNMYQTLDEWTSILGERIAVSEAIQKSLPYQSKFVQNFLLLPPSPKPGGLPRRVGFVGRLSHEKAPDRFCEIARRCKGLAEWHVWGDGPMRQELEQEFGRDVVFHGLVTDLTAVWASLGLLMMPSRAEGLPMAALEALSAGIPIAATPVGGLPGLVRPGETGWLFDGASIADAADCVASWAGLSSDQQQHMRSKCWTVVNDGFSDRQQLPKILDAYRDAGLIPTRISTDFCGLVSARGVGGAATRKV
ncbi:MAG: glycosyltransferase family 4 protein [Hyphomicrobiaceae bacterium]